MWKITCNDHPSDSCNIHGGFEFTNRGLSHGNSHQCAWLYSCEQFHWFLYDIHEDKHVCNHLQDESPDSAKHSPSCLTLSTEDPLKPRSKNKHNKQQRANELLQKNKGMKSNGLKLVKVKHLLKHLAEQRPGSILWDVWNSFMGPFLFSTVMWKKKDMQTRKKDPKGTILGPNREFVSHSNSSFTLCSLLPQHFPEDVCMWYFETD